MGCEGPDPPENPPHEFSTVPTHELPQNSLPFLDNDSHSDEEDNDNNGYRPLPQGPEGSIALSDDDDECSDQEVAESEENVPPIEPIDRELVREVWNAPRAVDPIQMDNERVQQVLTAMANFELPQSSIPEWAQSITEDQWRQTLQVQISKLKQ